MHPLQNGSQATTRPAPKPIVGTAGWFTESGDNNKPSFPGQDWFNHVIAEFQNALAAQGVTFDPTKEDHLSLLFSKISSVVDDLAPLANKYTVNIKDFNDLKSAIDALPSTGGVVIVPIGRWSAGNWDYDVNYMSKPNVKIIGEKKPCISSNADRLINGSVIYGRFNAYADFFQCENVGFDMGIFTINEHYSGASTLTNDYPFNGGTWDAFAFAQPNLTTPLAPKLGVKIKDVIGLQSRPLSLGHGVLIENAISPDIDNVTSYYGVHGCVVKCENPKIGTIEGYMSSTDNVIFKSDTYAKCGFIKAKNIITGTLAPGITPWVQPQDAAFGLLINPATEHFTGPVQIDNHSDAGSLRQISAYSPANFQVGEVQLGNVAYEGVNSVTGVLRAIDNDNGCVRSLQINSAVVNNVTDVLVNNTNGITNRPTVQIGSLKVYGVTGKVIDSKGESDITIDKVDGDNVNVAYSIADTSRVKIGTEKWSSLTMKFDQNNPNFAVGWGNFGGGNSSFNVVMGNYGVILYGLLTASSGATANVFTLPDYLMPSENYRFITYSNKSGTKTSALLNVTPSTNVVSINDGDAPSSGDYISIDGISWTL